MQLSAIRTLVYAYLGTTSSDPFYPSTTVNSLINAVANGYITDIQQLRPDWLSKTATIAAVSSTSRTYSSLPADFAGWLELRITDSSGSPLAEVRSDELNLSYDAPVFAITGSDAAAVITTCDAVDAGVALWLKHIYQPVELSADGDTPSWMPAPFHDLIARDVAIDAFGLGNEGSPSPTFVEKTEDRRAAFWMHVTKRGPQPLILRNAT